MTASGKHGWTLCDLVQSQTKCERLHLTPAADHQGNLVTFILWCVSYRVFKYVTPWSRSCAKDPVSSLYDFKAVSKRELTLVGSCVCLIECYFKQAKAVWPSFSRLRSCPSALWRNRRALNSLDIQSGFLKGGAVLRGTCCPDVLGLGSIFLCLKVYMQWNLCILNFQHLSFGFFFCELSHCVLECNEIATELTAWPTGKLPYKDGR